jgi:CBASS immunity sensor of nucleotide second messenger signals
MRSLRHLAETLLTRAFLKRWQARRLLVFYFGPLSGACFLGHRLNAVCQEVQIMEDQQPGYAPSFTLK